MQRALYVHIIFKNHGIVGMSEFFIGLMSGTSLDGIDAALVEFQNNRWHKAIAHTSLPYPTKLKEQILSLQTPDFNELTRTSLLANKLAFLYAQTVQQLLQQTGMLQTNITAIGCHGQTIRHAPEKGYTIQIGNLPLLAELTQIDVIGDFRNRDIAAKGQGAPLVPAFHQDVFASPSEIRAILNIGGIANISMLNHDTSLCSGFDTGPGNMLMDAWVMKHWQKDYDEDGKLAAQGSVDTALLNKMLEESYFSTPAPKSTGRDLFNMAWILKHLQGNENPLDVLATLLQLTVQSITNSINASIPELQELFLCGGGANNVLLFKELKQNLPQINIQTTDMLGLPTQWVEAAAFAWLAYQFVHHLPGNLPLATGAIGPRILGAWYPA